MSPIALLAFLSKVLERLVHLQITDYIETTAILDSFQTGCREGHSTQTTLLKLTDEIRHKINWKEQVSNTCRKAFSLLHRLNFFRNFELRRHLIKALLFSILDYCSLVWCDFSQEMDKKLQIIMNAGIHYIYGIREREHIAPYRSSLQ